MKQRKMFIFHKRLFWFFSIVFSLSVHAVVIEKVVATVNDEMISLSQMESYRKLLLSPWMYSNVLLNLRSKNTLLKNKHNLLRHLIDEKILNDSIPNSIISVVTLPSEEELLKKTLKTKKISRKKLKRKLKRIGFTLEEYQTMLYRNALWKQWVDMEISSLIQVSDQDVNDYYFGKKRRNLFTTHKYEFHQWSFELNQQGKDLAETLIKEGSLGSHKPQLKILTKAQMNSSLRKAISNLLPGQFSKPLCINNNCYVFELLNKSFANTQSQQAQTLRKQLFKKIFLSRLQSWMNQKRQISIVKKFI